MRIALHLPPLADRVDTDTGLDGLALALADAAGRAGCTAEIHGRTAGILAMAPDLVITIDAFTGKRTGLPTFGWLRADPATFRDNWQRVRRLVSHDGILAASPAAARFMADTLAPTDKRAVIGLLPPDDPAAGLAALPGLLAACRAAGHFDPQPADPALPRVDYITRIGSRPLSFVARALDSLAAQTYPRLGLVLARFAPVAGLDGLLERLRPRFERIEIVDLEQGYPRSTPLWAGLSAVTAQAFGLLDDDDALQSNHVASLMALLRSGPAGVVCAGSIRVMEAGGASGRSGDPAAENRDLHYLDFPARGRLLADRVAVHSSAFIARTALRTAIGPDPDLHMFEDGFLLHRLARQTAFAMSWRPTSELYWREDARDNSAFDQAPRAAARQRLADLERLDPVIADLRAGEGDGIGGFAPGWGAVPDMDGDPLPSLAGAADFHSLPGDRPILLHGTGRGGLLVWAEMQKFPRLHLAGFLDNGREGDFQGLPVRRPDALPVAERAAATVLIANQYGGEIAAQLRALGYGDIRDAYPYIRFYTDLIPAALDLDRSRASTARAAAAPTGADIKGHCQ